MRDNLSRRRFLVGLAVAGPTGSLVLSNAARAGAHSGEMPKLAVDDPLAVGLQYVEDATTSTAPTYKAGQTCANCLQIKGEDGEAYRPCAIVPGKLVASAGWCSAWVAKS